MYEEEDDDLPFQYRRMNAQLNSQFPTNSADLSRRLSAYVTNQLAMNAALNQAMGGQYGQQNVMNQSWQQNFPMQQQQQMWQQQMMQQSFNPQMMAPPQMMQNNANNFRQAPYPTPFQMPQQVFRPNMPQRTASTQKFNVMPNQVMPQNQHVSPVLGPDEHRRMSAPVQPPSLSSSPGSQAQSNGFTQTQRNTSSASLPNLATLPSPAPLPAQSNTIMPTTELKSDPSSQQDMMSQSPFTQGAFPQTANMDMNPLSSMLPPETQMFLGANIGGMPMNGLFNSNMASGMVKTQPFYSYNPNNFAKGRSMHPSFDGMNQTLAPGALDTNSNDATNWPTPASASTLSAESVTTPFATNAFTMGFPDAGLIGTDVNKFQQFNLSSLPTPGEAEWNCFIDSSSYEDNANTTA